MDNKCSLVTVKKGIRISFYNIKRNFNKIIFGLLIFSLFFGESISISGIKVSWIMVLINIISIVFSFNSLNQKIQLLGGCYLYFILFWFIYATLLLGIDFVLYSNKSSILFFYFSLLIDFLIVFLVIFKINSLEDILNALYYMVLGGCFLSLLCIWGINTGLINMTVQHGFEVVIKSNNIVSTLFGQPNDASTNMFLCLIATFICVFYKKGNQVLNFATIILLLYCVNLMESRSVFIGCILFIMFSFLFYIMIKVFNSNKFGFYLLCFTLLSIFIIISIIFLSEYSITGIIKTNGNSGNTESDLYRYYIMIHVIKNAGKSFFLGLGPGISTILLGINPHNMLLEILADYGFIVFGGVVWILGRFISTYKTNLPDKIKSIMMAFVPSFLMVSIASSSALRLRLVWVLFVLLMLLRKCGESNVLNKYASTRK